MKVCRTCGEEIGTRDGDNYCRACDDLRGNNQKAKLAKRRAARKERDELMESCGLVKVRGALGGTYWE